ncbi:hypothetical protein BKA67DRAFT_203401 [Truncatella angustata]|uniref:Uncharacterized protein n=1 Tax=Truncatella angustata TaxID=152316 RepID=A0A9P8UT29_9PEZI|nr:uncharacterized protein BKA67DRAFT_203401 [Truncatella angustata]KAH6657972.1 hypothetical protein BKA67DRAFT_203401 [Truncatella angustata]KAH8198814.1 hypothetical protein TruAng_007037 [Truncatella angustata]
MSLSLDTVFQVVEIVQKAVAIYERIKDAPDTIRKLGRRMGRLETILEGLENYVRNNSKHALARLRQSQSEDLLHIIDETREDCSRVYVLFEKWEKKIGPLGLQFKDNAFAQYVAQSYFALGSSAKELESLAADVEIHRRDLDQYMALMGVQGIQANQDAIMSMKQQIQQLHKLVQANVALAAPQPTAPAQAGGKKKRKPSPSPSPPKRDFKVIFIDPHNLGRSVCAEVLMDLYRADTKKRNGDWRIATIHSAGFFCKSENDCIEMIEKLDYKHGSYKMGMSKGATSPNEAAIASVFHNKNFEKIKDYKTDLYVRTDARVSRGIKKDVFKQYDYIIVFTGREHDNMIRLRSAITAKDGKDAAPKGKGRVVHLGSYSSTDGSVKEIVDPPKNKDGTHSRDEWNKKVAELKIAIRGFLHKEMEWNAEKAS